jgi:hypothetical protein
MNRINQPLPRGYVGAALGQRRRQADLDSSIQRLQIVANDLVKAPYFRPAPL